LVIRGGLQLIQEPSQGIVLSEVSPEAPAATGNLRRALAGRRSSDREAAGPSMRLPDPVWRAAKLFTRALRSCFSGRRSALWWTTLEMVSAGAPPRPFRERVWWACPLSQRFRL